MKYHIRTKDTGNKKGWGLYATRSFGIGDVVFSELTSSSVIQPLRSVNHSCNPNCELHLLLAVAIRPIRKGGEITIEYARIGFRHQPMKFKCLCKSINCRGVIDV